jgi:hypothetical protein
VNVESVRLWRVAGAQWVCKGERGGDGRAHEGVRVSEQSVYEGCAGVEGVWRLEGVWKCGR